MQEKGAHQKQMMGQPYKLKVMERSHADRFVVMLAHCRGIRRMYEKAETFFSEQAPTKCSSLLIRMAHC